MESRWQLISTKLSEAFGLESALVESALRDYTSDVNQFLEGKGPQTLSWQRHHTAGGESRLHIALDQQQAKTKTVMFFRAADNASAISCIEVAPNMAASGSLATMLKDVFVPLTEEQPPSETRDAAVAAAARALAAAEQAAAASDQPSLLCTPDRRFFEHAQSKPQTLANAAESPAAVHLTSVLEDWCAVTEGALTEDALSASLESAKPAKAATDLASELQRCRNRASKLALLVADAQKEGSKVACQVAAVAAPTALKRWRKVEARLQEALNDAEERTAVTSQMLPALLPVLAGTLADAVLALPGAFQRLRVASTATHAFSRAGNMRGMLNALGSTLAQRSTASVAAGGKLWDQPRSALLAKLDEVASLHSVFDRLCRDILEEVAKEGDAAATPFSSVAKRCAHLRRLLAAVERFAMLGKQSHIPGVPDIATSFFEIAAPLKRQLAVSADQILDLSSSTWPDFDKDMLDFGVHVNELELALQKALRTCFDAAPTTERALGLLRQHAALLPPDAVEGEVGAMYTAAFDRFAADLEAVQQHYEKNKSQPPVARGAPPSAGAVQWSRALLRRVERPMRMFAAHAPLIAAKESRKSIKAYNRLVQTLLEFEGLVHTAWARSAEATVALMQAPVLIQHPTSGQLHVNLDAGVFAVVKEGTWLGRMGLPIPDRVLRAMQAAELLQAHHGALAAAVAALVGAQATLPPALRPLGLALAKFVHNKAEPGLFSVHWTSATIDGFSHSFAQSVLRFCEIARRAMDIHDNGVEAAARAVHSMRFMDLTPRGPAPCDHFAEAQERFMAAQIEELARRDAAAHAACEEVVDIVAKELQQSGLEPNASANESYRQACGALLKAATEEAVSSTLAALHQRLGPVKDSDASDVSLLLALELRLEVAAVAAHPSVDEAKQVLSTCAASVVAVLDKLLPWGKQTDAQKEPSNTRTRSGPPAPQRKFARRGSTAAAGTTAAPAAAVPAAAVSAQQAQRALAEAVDGMQAAVEAHVRALQPFEFLWAATSKQMDAPSSPDLSLEEVGLQLRHMGSLQEDLEALPAAAAVQGVVSLSLEPFKHAVRAEITNWKARYAESLHSRALGQLRELQTAAQSLAQRLSINLEDLQDVATVLGCLTDAREAEMEFERKAQGIEEQYSMLVRNGVFVSKEETDSVGELAGSLFAVRQAAIKASEVLQAAQTLFVGDVRSAAEALAIESADFRAQWDEEGPTVHGLLPQEAASRLVRYKAEFENLKRKWDRVAVGEELFGLPQTPLPGLRSTQDEIASLDQLYTLYTSVMATLKESEALPWSAADAAADALATRVAEHQTASKKIPKSLREWPAFKDARKAIEDVAGMLPIMQRLSHPAVRERHWKEVSVISGVQLPTPAEGLTLGHLLAASLLAHQEEVEDLCSAVVKEDAVERKLKSVEEQWAAEVFTFAEHKQRGPVVLKPTETSELMERLEDSVMVLGSLSASRFSAPFRPELQALTGKLGAVEEVMERWLAVQSMWTYMEVVFTGGDIVRQLPAEAKRFQAIDRAYVKMVGQARENGRVTETCAGSDTMRTLLSHLLEQLELCQKSLSAYLETKRSEFPRFYFVSDPTLLEILSLGSDPSAVAGHFQSGLFDGLASVTFDPADKYKITEMHSREGEKVVLAKPVDAKGPVEVWLQRLVTGMQDTVKFLIREAAFDAKSDDLDLADFMFNRPAQVALLGLQMRWTGDMVIALQAASREEKGALTKALKRADATLRDLVSLALRDDLTKLQRTALETCITVFIHQKEATEELVRKRIKDPRDFEWLKQCRITWREDRDSVVISICDVDLEYSYEYLGVKERLVITPLTDVCYVTLTQALGMYLGGAPAGPAGTGKTETTKDLGATLGKFVVVFNCSDQMDHKGMGRIYKGLAQSGLWGCFDEFNRINLDVLSVCAQQISCVLGAMRERRKSFVFTDGSTVPLDPRVGFFITMNPGYAGRQELPENLKALFRGVTMMVPNRQIIMKVKLAAAGFQENDVLAKKFNVLYALCEQQLSKQSHYDFGLRNILSVLRTAGASKRANPAMSETEIMMRTLRDMNMSKFVAEDVPLFLALIEDIFPGQKPQHAAVADVATALERVCKERGLQPHPSWIQKCMQLYETSIVRHGIMVVGPSGSGKSSAIDSLAAALTELGQRTVVWRMNPKAITAPQMFGRMDAATGDWTDGVFSTLWRRAARAPKGQATWIVLDGPVDAVWIENLNTVLDDNKVLTLANGDRVLMTPHMRLVFEAENLNNASPATVSRAGIIYMSESELGWAPVAQSWLELRPQHEASLLKPCFDKLVEPALEFIRLNCAPVMRTQAVCLVGSLCTLLTGVLGGIPRGGGEGPDSGEPDQQQQKQADPPPLSTARRNSAASTAGAATHPIVSSDGVAAQTMERHFLFCLVWSLGGLLTPKDRIKLDTCLRGLSQNLPPTSSTPGDSVYEYFVDGATGEWRDWASRVPEWRYPAARNGKDPRFTQMVVPTVDSVRYERLMSLSHAAGKAPLLVGGPGTAKTTIMRQFLSRFDPDTHTSKTITFSSLTTPGIFQAAVEGNVEKRQGRTYGPPAGKKASLFVDDLSMPAINQWGDQITNELMRQVLEQGGWYSTEKPVGELKQLADMSFAAAMTVPGAGRADIPNRLKRHFCVFFVPDPSEASITGVFGQIVGHHFSAERCAAAVAAAAPKLVTATMQLWNAAKSRLLPTPAKLHYSFTLRDISRVFQGVMLASVTPMTEKAAAGGSGEAYLVGLWAHECRRVFAAKLIVPEEKIWMDATLHELAASVFGPILAEAAAAPVAFADFLRDGPVDEVTGEPLGPRPSCYEAAPEGLVQIRQRAEALLAAAREQCRPGEAPPELVLFDDATQHVLRVSRLLAMDRGSALLVGVGGSGKQSCARVAAHLAGATCFKITLTKTYGVSNLLEDLKTLYRTAALKPQPVAFIVTESDIKDEAFLEYLNQVLMTGEVAGLFPKEELDAVLNDIRPLMRAQDPGLPDTWENLYSFFINRVRDKLHLVLCISPVGPRFARWAQQFPGLINGCTVDWFLPWPQEALISVSSKLQGASPELAALQPTQMTALQQLMAWVHTHAIAAGHQYHVQYRRAAHVTPKSFISALEAFQQLFSRKLSQLRATMTRLGAGIEKMSEAKKDVGRMRVELGIKDKELAVASAEAEHLLAEISDSTAAAEKERAKVAIIVEAVRKKAEEIAAVKADAEKDLQAAQPALEAALSALNSITPKDITSLKALRSPPDVVKRIFDCVLLLRHFPVGKVTWQEFKGAKVIVGSYDEAVRMMGDLSFLQRLLNFPKEAINDETVELLQPYFTAPDFNYDSAKKASGAVAGLCNWAESMCSYHDVAKAVEPKIIALHAAEAELKVAEAERGAAESELEQVQAALEVMQTKLEAAVAHKAALEADATATRRKMDNAVTLMGALGGEESRWIVQEAALRAAEANLVGDCAIASSFLSYLGPFNRVYRERLLSEMAAQATSMGLSLTPEMSISSFLADEAEVAQWAAEGLPTDPLSLQNGVLVTQASRWPLLIDPQGQGRAWLARRESKAGLRITRMADDGLRSALEHCLSSGLPLLIENVEEELDPVLDPVLERKFVKKGRTLTVLLGDREVEMATGFRLFLTCRLPTPRFTPEIFAKATVVDFTVTPSGLEDQLLAGLVLREKRELEEQRRRLVEEVAAYTRRVAQLESDLLTRLSTSSGNLLDDTQLVEVLAMTKSTATDVAAKMTTASDTRKRITATYEEYRPAAHRAMLLYFVVADLSGVNPMYQTSLSQFTTLYEAAIDAAERPPTAAERAAAIASHFTASLFDYVQRGLFERHKLVFGLMVALRVATSAGQVKAEAVDAFLRLGPGADVGPGAKKKPKEWIPANVWRNVLLLAERMPGAFAALPEAVAIEDASWAAWYNLEAPESTAPPHYNPAKSMPSAFEALCLVRAFREDRALLAAGRYVASTLGPSFVEPALPNLERSWASSGPRCPVVCLLSPGADSTKAIEDLAKRKRVKSFGVSMGQGQEIVARKLVAAAAAEGHWVLLQNAHLGLQYLVEVEQYLAKLEAPHEAFRLWITTDPHPSFPLGLLQSSVRATNEAPVGIRAGLRASYQWLTQDMLDAVARPEWRSLLFSLCFLHSVVQERRKFGPIGWNIPYEFNAGDLGASVQALQNHIAEMAARKAARPDWTTVRYMISTIQYGGRITDDNDRALMDAYAERFFNEGVLAKGVSLFTEPGPTGAKYAVPEGTDIEAYRSAIEALPPQESPELFGLHTNADLTFRELQVAEAMAVVESTRPKGGAVAGATAREDGVDKVAADLLAKLPSKFKPEETAEALRKVAGGPTAPLNIHLRQEAERLTKVVAAVADTLRMLRLATAGTIAMGDELLGVLDAVHAGKVPPAWLKLSWESPSLGSWFQGLLQRHAQLNSWLTSGRPKTFWLPGFFNPQAFLTAVKQEVTRRHAAENWALDDVVLVSEVTKTMDPGAVKEGPPEGVYVHGLSLEGASWNLKDGRLADPEPKKLFAQLPVMLVTAVQAKDKKRSGYFEAPCYRVRRRTGLNFVSTFMLRTEEERTKWILRGAALLGSVE